MKVLICTCDALFSPSAARNRLRHMRDALALHGIETILIGEGDELGTQLQEVPTEHGLCIAYSGPRRHVRPPFRALSIGLTAARFYRNHLYRIIKTYGCSGIIDYTAQAIVSKYVMAAARLSGTFVVADAVERFAISWYNILNGMNLQQFLLCRSILPRMDGIIGISRAWCQWADELGLKNVWIPSFAKDHGVMRTFPSANDKPFTLVFMGHWTPRELPLEILQSIRLCINRGLNIRMNVLGAVGTRYMERKAMRFLRRNPGLQACVKFLGFVSDENRDRELAEADAFVILRPDNRETDMLFPTRLPEYMLTGNPVILSKVGSFPHCFEHGKDVWFVSSENKPVEVAEALLFLAQNPQERLAIGRKGRQTVLSGFSLEFLGKRLASFLRLVGGGGGVG